MITACWIFVAFVAGGCAGLLLMALLRTAADQSLDALVPAESRRSAYNRIEGEQCQRLTEQADETLADARFPVPLYVIAAAALLG